MNIVNVIGIKAARKISDLDVSDDDHYNVLSGEITSPNSDKSSDYISIKDLKHTVKQYRIVMSYGSPGLAKEHLSTLNPEDDEFLEINEALEYFRESEGLDI